MNEVVDLARDWRLAFFALAFFGVTPGIVLRLVVRIYPRGHARREELVAELYSMGFPARPLWVAQQFETAIFEGMPARRAHRRPDSVQQLVGLASELHRRGTIPDPDDQVRALYDMMEWLSPRSRRRLRRLAVRGKYRSAVAMLINRTKDL